MAERTDWDGVPVYTLENEELHLSLCPAYGNNLYRIWDKRANRDVLRTPEHAEILRDSPVHYGTPLLLPPSRIRHGKFRFDERDYQLDINTQDGHHIHGFLRNHPWDFDERSSNGAVLISTFDTAKFPDIMKQYPHPITVQVTYVLEGSSLLQRTAVTNHGETFAPFGYGLHTWFKLDGGPDRWSLHLPVEELWQLGYGLLPTRERVPLGELAGLKDKLPLAGRQLDHVFRVGSGPRLAVLSRDGYEIRYSASDAFTQWVIYTKGIVDDVICLEPLTWTPNAPNLELPAELTGMRAIAPGETLELEVLLELKR